MTFWTIAAIVYALIVFMAFAMFFVGGDADAETERFLKEMERER